MRELLFLLVSIVGVAALNGDTSVRRLLSRRLKRKKSGITYSPPNCMKDRNYDGQTCVVRCHGKDACDGNKFPTPKSPAVKTLIVRCTGSGDDKPCKGQLVFPKGQSIYLMCLSGLCDGINKEYTRHVDFLYCARNKCEGGALRNKNVDKIETKENGLVTVLFTNGLTVGADPNKDNAAGFVVDCMGAWDNWSACAPCGTSTQHRVYQVTRPASQGGNICNAVNQQRQERGCNKAPCKCANPPVAPLNGQMTLSSGNEDGSEATFSCNNGFTLVGSNKVICESKTNNQPWPPATAICTGSLLGGVIKQFSLSVVMAMCILSKLCVEFCSYELL